MVTENVASLRRISTLTHVWLEVISLKKSCADVVCTNQIDDPLTMATKDTVSAGSWRKSVTASNLEFWSSKIYVVDLLPFIHLRPVSWHLGCYWTLSLLLHGSQDSGTPKSNSWNHYHVIMTSQKKQPDSSVSCCV